MQLGMLPLWTALGLGLAASAALAQEPPKAGAYVYTATTAAAARAQGAVMAQGTRWQCSANRCTATGPWPIPGVKACQALAQQVGEITSYGHKGRQLSAAELRVCNGSATAASTSGAKPQLAANAVQAKPRTQRPTGSSGGALQLPAGAGSAVGGLQRGGALRSEHYDNLRRARAEAELAARREREAAVARRRANAVTGDDCNDERSDVHPGAAELCDGHDNNCDGMIDEGQTLVRYLDADGDGHGDAARRLDACPADINGYAERAESSGTPWLVEIGNDCDDADPARWRDCR